MPGGSGGQPYPTKPAEGNNRDITGTHSTGHSVNDRGQADGECAGESQQLPVRTGVAIMADAALVTDTAKQLT